MFNPARCLTLKEVLVVLKDLHRRSKRSLSKRLDLMIFRLSCCVGLRRSEIGGLRLDDIVLDCPKPHVKVRRDNTKGRSRGKAKERKVRK